MSKKRFLQQQTERLRQAKEQSAAQFLRYGAEAGIEQPAQTTKTPGNASAEAWQTVVEQRIQQGMGAGVFDNLPGVGKPLNLWDDAFVPEEMRMAFRLLRSNDLAPLWVQVNREIQEDLRRMRRVREYAEERWHKLSVTQRDAVRDDYERKIGALNTKILNYNLLAPSSSVHLPLLLADELLTAFDDALATL